MMAGLPGKRGLGVRPLDVSGVVTLGGLLGVIRGPWTERRVVLVAKQPREVISRQDPATGQYSSEVVALPANDPCQCMD
jgi:hypothetical protein